MPKLFRIGIRENRIFPLSQEKFSNRRFRERANLQEWLVHEPDALDEDLLIIQKEFDGFADTRERLDLLALDKKGCLVVIENKLDDSGSNVVWQALKYWTFVASLKPSEIVEIYQKYLDRYCQGGSANDKICEFLEVEDLQEAELNFGDSQRIILIAANFRREVTATVMRLIGHGLDIRCFQAKLYGRGEEYFLDLRLIIPIPESGDFMIRLSSKEKEETEVHGKKSKTHALRVRFWTKALEQLRAENVSLYANINPSDDHWINAGAGVGGCHFGLIFKQTEVRVELSLERNEKDKNKILFDKLLLHRQEIEDSFGGQLEWRRMDDSKASRIVYGCKFDGYCEDNWDDMISWLVQHIQKLDGSISALLKRYGPMVR